MKTTSLALSALLLTSAAIVGCSSESEESSTSGGGATTTTTTDTGGGGAAQGGAGQGGNAGGAGQGGAGGNAGGAGQGGAGGSGGGAPETGNVRVAHLSPDAPAVDFCVKEAAAAAFTGPVMKALLMKDAGLAYPEVTGYLPLPAGTYTVRLVEPGQDSCDADLGIPDVEGLAIAAGGTYTAAAIGMLTPPDGAQAFQVTAWGDDADVAAGKAKLRFVHASADTPNVDVGTGSGETFAAVFPDVAFGKAGDVGGKAYLETDPLSKVTLSARATGTTEDALVLENVDLPEGVIATAFAIGNLGGAPQPLKALVCLDNQPAQGGLTTCLVLP